MPDVLTVRQAVTRCKAEVLPVSEYALRSWIKMGVIPTRKAGQKALIFYPNLVRFLQCTDGADNVTIAADSCGIRRVEL